MECPICYELKQCEITVCDHNVCFDCLYRWLMVSNECPMCRAFLNPGDNFEIVIVNEHDGEMMSVIYPDTLAKHFTDTVGDEPEKMICLMNDKFKIIPSTCQFVNDSRSIYFIFYVNGKSSKKWYMNDFALCIQNRLCSHTKNNNILKEMELVISEVI